jgi:hypothetical protein
MIGIKVGWRESEFDCWPEHKIFLLCMCKPALRLSEPPIQCIVGTFIGGGGNWSGHKADHLNLFGAEVNVWSYTCFPPKFFVVLALN